jgi:hypothetical protein
MQAAAPGGHSEANLRTWPGDDPTAKGGPVGDASRVGDLHAAITAAGAAVIGTAALVRHARKKNEP